APRSLQSIRSRSRPRRVDFLISAGLSGLDTPAKSLGSYLAILPTCPGNGADASILPSQFAQPARIRQRSGMASEVVALKHRYVNHMYRSSTAGEAASTFTSSRSFGSG